MRQTLRNHPYIVVVVVAFLLRLLLFPFAQVVDADAVTRVFMAQEWWDNPVWISEGVWPPFHQYLYGLVIGVTGDYQTAPIVFSMFLSALTAWPMYLFIKREFNERAAIWISIALVLSPVLFRNSYHTLSGTPFILLLVFTLNFVSKAWREKDLRSAIWAGIFMTLACGFRYEGWMLFALFTGFGLIQRAWRETAIFWIVGMIFPAIWLIGNYIEHQDFFYGLSGAYNWNIVQEGVNAYLPRDIMLLRWFFFPASWFFLFSPILVFTLFAALWRLLRKRIVVWEKWRWGAIFLIMLIVFIYKSHHGTLLNQHRFTSSLIVFSLPTLALVWEVSSKWMERFTQVGIVLLIPLSFVWMKPDYKKVFNSSSSTFHAIYHFQFISNQGLDAIPRLRDQRVLEINKVIEENLNDNCGFIVDFIDWESTYNIALNSGLKRNQLFILNGALNAEHYVSMLEDVILANPNGVLLVKKDSPMIEMIEFYGSRSRDEDFYKINEQKARIVGNRGIFLDLNLVKNFGDVYVFTYSKKKS